MRRTWSEGSRGLRWQGRRSHEIAGQAINGVGSHCWWEGRVMLPEVEAVARSPRTTFPWRAGVEV